MAYLRLQPSTNTLSAGDMIRTQTKHFLPLIAGMFDGLKEWCARRESNAAFGSGGQRSVRLFTGAYTWLYGIIPPASQEHNLTIIDPTARPLPQTLRRRRTDDLLRNHRHRQSPDQDPDE